MFYHFPHVFHCYCFVFPMQYFVIFLFFRSFLEFLKRNFIKFYEFLLHHFIFRRPLFADISFILALVYIYFVPFYRFIIGSGIVRPVTKKPSHKFKVSANFCSFALCLGCQTYAKKCYFQELFQFIVYQT